MLLGKRGTPGLLPPESNLKKHLYPHEWAATLFLLGLIALLCGLNTYSYLIYGGPDSSGSFHSSPCKIRVFVDGAVACPGHFELSKDQRLEDLLVLVEPSCDANLEGFRPRSRLKDGQRIHVPAHQFIQIEVKGAVKSPGKYRVPLGCRPKDLPKWIPLSEEADTAKLSRKRKRAQEGVVIEIPFKPSG